MNKVFKLISRIISASIPHTHEWEYQFPDTRHEMGEKRWCSCGQVELAYEVWRGTYWSFDSWVREEDWYKLGSLDAEYSVKSHGLP